MLYSIATKKFPFHPFLIDRFLMAKSGKNKSKSQDATSSNERVISENRKAKHDYHIVDSLECGLVLVGSEVKSLRSGTVSLSESYGRVREGEVWLINCDIPVYPFGNRFNHQPRRERKLLLHRREIIRFANRAYEKGLTLVPLKLYFREGKVKVLLGLCKGKQDYDKRDTEKKKDMDRGLRQATMYRRL